MEQNFILSELSAPKTIINSFQYGDKGMLIVQRESIRVCRDIQRNEFYGDSDATMTTGYNVGAYLFHELSNSTQYLFLLKETGAIEVLDSRFKTVDLLDTGIKPTSKNYFFFFSLDTNILYINLEGTKIHKLPYSTKRETFSFIHTNTTAKVIYTFPHDIINMQPYKDINPDGEECTMIAVLMEDVEANNIFFEVIGEKGRRPYNIEWSSIINYTEIATDSLKSNTSYRSQICSKTATLAVVDFVGSFVFTSLNSHFFISSNYTLHHVDGINVPRLYIGPGLDLTTTSVTESRDPLTFFKEVVVVEDFSGILFKIISSNVSLIEIKLTLIHFDEEQLIRHWKGFTIKQQPLLLERENLNEERPVEPFQLSNIFSLANTSLLLSCFPGNLFVIDVNDLTQHSHSGIDYSSVIYSNFIGQDITKKVSTGTASPSYYRGFITTYFDGILTEKTFIYDLQTSIRNFWYSKSGDIWWITEEDDDLFCNNELIEKQSNTIQVTYNGEMVRDHQIVCSVPTINDEGNFCSITKDGHISWNDETERVKIPNFKDNLLVRYLLGCTKRKDGSKVSIISFENKLLLVEDMKITRAPKNLKKELNVTISDIFFYSDVDTEYLFVADIDGRILVFNPKNNAMLDVCKLDNKRLKFCYLGESNLVVYSIDNAFRLKISSSEILMNIIELPFFIHKLAKRNSSSFILLNENNSLYDVTVDNEVTSLKRSMILPSTIITKFVTLSCSSRYTIGICQRYSKPDDGHLSRANLSDLCIFDTNNLDIPIKYMDLPLKYPGTIISDLTAITFKEDKSGQFMTFTNERIDFAKQVAFDKLLMISLDYSATDQEDSSPNLLLFSLDEMTGDLQFHYGVNTRRRIDRLLNYYNRSILIGGECLEFYQIDYLLKENIFLIELVSNKFEIGGPILEMTLPPITLVYHKDIKNIKTKKRKTVVEEDTLLVLNIFKGIQQLKLTIEENDHKGPLRIQISPVLSSKELSLLKNIQTHDMIFAVAMVETSDMVVFAVCVNGKELQLYYRSNNPYPEEEEAEEEGENAYSYIEILLPMPIIQLESLRITPRKNQGLIQRPKLDNYFMITTQDSGSYILGSVTDEGMLSEQKFELKNREKKMVEQYKYIGLLNKDDEGTADLDLTFIDDRLLSACRKK
ncbi:Mlo127p NDAI_0G04820 [Naumovozyma dairenensis CBS 421]|uniref:Cleavage/polyadenylation specificity factor A subunit N-terminal domain-containing protein n=1 Tax=Naumovozyma dairenensis (strain ATCC 10597 / BCRC 20456 / CBS 421 / NBRC 0211 / NRRL Y-12639) TaxID=1071378 RepID=J7SBQ0_NAUDC|nr:hypothetical protein NDAI_0G04820 [Naumovozyma dairenensis CBS 421]CCK73465.1 hypothetical protein NDAI_0G04820 [Naumovozyma dairenensis CBS 421]